MVWVSDIMSVMKYELVSLDYYQYQTASITEDWRVATSSLTDCTLEKLFDVTCQRQIQLQFAISLPFSLYEVPLQ